MKPSPKAPACATRPPLARMLRIHQALQSGSYPNATRLAADLEVSTKSIHRDLEFMRDRLELPLEFDPGTKFKYSNTGYILLGAVIEKASGLPYAEFMQRNIFDPLGLRDTGIEDPRKLVSKRAKGKVYFDYLQVGRGRTISALTASIWRTCSGLRVSSSISNFEGLRRTRTSL